MATTCSISVTKNADGSYDVTSGDQTNARGWQVHASPYDNLEDLSSISKAVWNEILRQIRQI